MRKILIVGILTIALIATIGLVSAGYGPGTGEEHLNENFADVDGDGVCDNWVDADGDGMNDLRPIDGSGYQHKYGAGPMNGLGNGPHDRTGHKGLGLHDGTGHGPGNCQE